MTRTQSKMEDLRLLQQKAYTPVDEKLWKQLVPWLLHRQEQARAILKSKNEEDIKLLHQAMEMTEGAIKELLGMHKPFLM